jgi:hypothetical protein
MNSTGFRSLCSSWRSDCAIPNPNLLIKSFAYKIKHLLKNIVLLYSPGFYANALDAGL